MTPSFLNDDLDRLTTLVVTTLTKCGQARVCKDGHVQKVVIGRRGLTPSGMFLLKVDTERLPHGVYVENLVSERVLHQLTAVTHHSVDVLNTTGVVYVIHLGQTGQRQSTLPRRVGLMEVLPQHPGGLTIPVGQGPNGPVWRELDTHLLVGGETGAGKTTWLKSTLTALATVHKPETLQLLIVDPKGVDFLRLAPLSNLLQPIAVEPQEAEAAVGWLVDQVSDRRQRFLSAPADSLEKYNAQAQEPLPYLVAVVDEITNLVDLTGGKKGRFHRQLKWLAGIGRSFGIRLILATQNPKADILDTHLRGNLGLRIAFRVSTAEHSKVILGTAGAEKLLGIKGRLLARLGGARLQELQGYAVPDDDLTALLNAGGTDFISAPARRMLIYAVQELAGRFPEREVCQGLQVSKRAYRKARDHLLAAGYLRRGANNALLVARLPDGE